MRGSPHGRLAVDGKTYARPNGGKWRHDKVTTPPKGSGPFGELRASELEFKGTGTFDGKSMAVRLEGLYTSFAVRDALVFKAPIE